MKFYIGDKVRMLDGCMVLDENPEYDFVSYHAGDGKIYTVSGLNRHSDGRIGLYLGDTKCFSEPCDYDKRGFELVERGPNAPKRRKKKAKAKKPTEEKPTPKFKVGDKVRVKMDLVPGKRYEILFNGLMAETRGHIGAVKEILFDSYYRIAGQPFIYSEEMLELAPETAERETEKPKEGKTLERGELIKTFMKLCETDKPLKELTDNEPLMVAAIVLILGNIENELLGEG